MDQNVHCGVQTHFLVLAPDYPDYLIKFTGEEESLECVSLDFGVMNSHPTWDVEIT